MQISEYVIRGGAEGRERLRLLSSTYRPATLALLSRAGIPRDATCVDVGCGGGDVTVELARHVGPGGRVIGIDRDEVELEKARKEAAELGLGNVQYHTGDARGSLGAGEFDVAYSRCLLSHLSDPAACVRNIQMARKPHGLVILEDIDIRGIFCYPENSAVRRFRELYAQVVRRRGADPDVGPRLPTLLLDEGFERVSMNVVQPAGFEGEVKLLVPLSMKLIADTASPMAWQQRMKLRSLLTRIFELARDRRTVIGTARVVQVWGYRAA
jgi:SAM-dependent methyltransferase